MAANSTLRATLDIHKKVVRPASVGLRQNGAKLLVTSTSASGNLSLWSVIDAEAAKLDAVVDFTAFSALVKQADVKMNMKDGRLFVKCGRTAGDLPTQNEDQAKIPKTESVKLSNEDAEWLCTNIPRVRLSDLDRTGLLSAECSGGEWRLSCVDDVHGACIFGAGKANIKFSLTPTDAEALANVINASDEAVSVGFSDSTLVVRTGPHVVAIPSVDGSAQTREVIDTGNKPVAKVKSTDLVEVMSTLAPVASAKDALPVTIKLAEKFISWSVTSPAGTTSDKTAARCTKDLEFRASHALLAALADKTNDIVTILVRSEGKDVNRITLQCGDLSLVMLTSS